MNLQPAVKPEDTAECCIEVAQGALRGSEQGGYRRFLAVPYAEPPVGRRRFLPALPPRSWDGLRDAQTQAPVAPQRPDPGFFPGDPDAMPASEMDEDCLYMNIWAPAAASAPCPVLVWLHGGSQLIGGTARPVYDGAAFARAGIVCVTVGHRLGLLGFMELEHHLGADYRESGNAALGDMIRALEWVRDNIGVFGGDAQRVTLGGESAGGKNVATLLAAPRARGLFQASVIVSGGGETILTFDEAKALANRVITLTGHGAQALCHLPWPDMLDAQRRLLSGGGRKLPTRPFVGGAILPLPPLAAIESGTVPPVPLLLGTSRDEMIASVLGAQGDWAWTPEILSHALPDDMTRIEGAARQAWPKLDAVARRCALLTAEEYWLPARRLADAQARAGAPVWMYRNDISCTTGPLAGYASHVSDLNALWGHLPALPSARLHRMLCDFVRNHAAHWDRYDPTTRRTAVLCNDLSVQTNPGADVAALFGAYGFGRGGMGR